MGEPVSYTHLDVYKRQRLDNLTSVQALLDGIITGEREDGINLIALFDHEEIGSRTKQGAGSMLLRDVVEKIQISLGRDACQVKEALYQSMLLSVDVAHAMHPNQNQKADVTNQPVLNRGFCIKESGNQSYACLLYTSSRSDDESHEGQSRSWNGQ